MTALAAPRRRPTVPSYIAPPPGPVGVVLCTACGTAVSDTATAQEIHTAHHAQIRRLAERLDQLGHDTGAL
jgi:hypothetical protein